MGKEIEQCLLKQNHTIAGIIDNENDKSSYIHNADCAIEFSTPETAYSNILWCIDNQLPVVTGTTGWHEHLPFLTEECSKKNGSVLWGSNFSIGMNVFFLMNKQLASIMNQFKRYRISAEEIHHIHKADKPSGTALTLLQDIISISDTYHKWAMEKEHYNDDEIPVIVKREGEIKGIHELHYESDEDILNIRHEAKSRQGFALGAIMAARWLTNKKGMYSFFDFFSEIINISKK